MHKKTIKICILATLFMFAFSFALIPIYDVLCDITGLNGKIDLTNSAALPTDQVQDRTIIVEFTVSFNQEMPWSFKPQHKSIKVRPGEVTSTGYFAINPTKKTMVGQAIPSISPFFVAKHFKKVECFCFSEQVLGPGQSANLPLRFYIEPDIPADVKRLTLSYTLFDMTEQKGQA